MILHITDYYAPRVGGIETQVKQLASTQRAAGHDVAVLTYTQASPYARDEPGSMAVHRITPVPPYRMIPHPAVLSRVRPFIERLNPTVVHAHFSCVSPTSWAGAWWATNQAIPTVVTVHSLWDRRTRAGHRASDWLLDWSRRIPLTAVSATCARHIRRALPHADVAVVPNGIHAERWRPAVPSPRRSSSAVHVVCVGRLTAWRQPLLALRALRLARDQLTPYVPLRATIVGSGPAEAEVRRYLSRHAMDRWVELTGHLDSAAIRTLFSGTDIYLNAASREAFGIATLEARTAGLPVVASSTTGVRDFIRHEHEGLLARDTDGLAAALVRLSRDVELRGRIAAHNRRTAADRCSWPEVMDAFRDRYDQAARQMGVRLLA